MAVLKCQKNTNETEKSFKRFVIVNWIGFFFLLWFPSFSSKWTNGLDKYIIDFTRWTGYWYAETGRIESWCCQYRRIHGRRTETTIRIESLYYQIEFGNFFRSNSWATTFTFNASSQENDQSSVDKETTIERRKQDDKHGKGKFPTAIRNILRNCSFHCV